MGFPARYQPIPRTIIKTPGIKVPRITAAVLTQPEVLIPLKFKNVAPQYRTRIPTYE